MLPVYSISIGQRVNVTNIVTENWQSEKILFNGYVSKIDIQNGTVVVLIDEDTTFSSNYTFQRGGRFYLTAYNITSTNKVN